MTRGFSTPVLIRRRRRMQAMVAGTSRLIAYDVDTGEEVWFVRGLTWQMKPTPVVDGDIAYVLGWAGGSDQGNQENVAVPGPMRSASLDANKDGKLAKDEMNPKHRNDFVESDLDRDGFMGAARMGEVSRKRSSVNSVMAVQTGRQGRHDGEEHPVAILQVAAQRSFAAAVQRCLYLMKEGGILTALDAKTGAVLKQGRLPGALDFYYSSPVGADGRSTPPARVPGVGHQGRR